MSKIENKIVIISPCRNESEFLPDLITCIVNQTLKPAEWIIVDDGSTDNTAEIAETASKNHKWIRLVKKPDRGVRSVGPGVIETFYYGFERLSVKDWNYICKMDGDLKLPPTYFEKLLYYFNTDDVLGAASGKLFLELESNRLMEERNSDESVWGCVNFYRRECFEDVGGFVREVMWDGIVFHRMRMEGWRSRSIKDEQLKIIDRRIMGSSHKGILHGRRRWGKGQYFMGTHVLYIIAVGFYRLWEKPYILGGLNIVFGYFRAMIKKENRYNYPGFIKSLHAWQFERLKIGKRVEEIPAPPKGLYKSQ